MIAYEPLSGVLRWYSAPDAALQRGDYVASCVAVWRKHPSDLELRGLSGAMSRARWRDLLGWLRELGVERLHAERVEGRVLPFASERGADHWQVINVAAAWERYGPSSTTPTNNP